MLKVKICGIKRQEDIEMVNRYLPEYAGFVFADSKRRVSIEEARDLISKMNKSTKAVGVFVNSDIDEIIEIICKTGLDIVQLHGDEDSEYIGKLHNGLRNIQFEVWKAIRVVDQNSLLDLDAIDCDAILLDTYNPISYGGTGEAFDWGMASGICGNKRIIIAGGLNIDNIEILKKTSSPFCVDVSSGVETNGFKDEMKIKAFIEAVRTNTGFSEVN